MRRGRGFPRVSGPSWNCTGWDTALDSDPWWGSGSVVRVSVPRREGPRFLPGRTRVSSYMSAAYLLAIFSEPCPTPRPGATSVTLAATRKQRPGDLEDDTLL